MKKILIFTDGASKGNPGPGGWGAVVADDDSIAELGGREERATNNRMEITAALEALRYAQRFGAGARVVVHTDSSYLINGMTKWARGWQKNGWMTKQKKPVLNRDLWEPLADVAASYAEKIEWVYVGGHVGIGGNERADALASGYADGEKVSLYAGARAGYSIDLKNITHNAALQKKKSSSRAHANTKAHSYVSAVDGKVLVHKTWAECEARVKGKKARYRKSISSAHEADIVKEFSGR